MNGYTGTLIEGICFPKNSWELCIVDLRPCCCVTLLSVLDKYSQVVTFVLCLSLRTSLVLLFHQRAILFRAHSIHERVVWQKGII